MKPVTIYLTRHGQTYYNLEERMQGKIDAPLTPLGEKQAQALGERLESKNFDVIYTSPLKRALKTASIVNTHHNTEIIQDERLMEMGFGSWEGLPIADLKVKFPNEAGAFWNAPKTYVPIDGESFESLEKRVRAFYKSVVEKHAGETIMVVCHGMVIRTMLTILKKMDIDNVWTHSRIYHTSLTVFDYDGENAEFEMIADASHFDFE